MPHLDPTWQSSVLVAALLVGLALALRWRGLPRLGAAVQEVAVVATLFGAWQVIGTFTHRFSAGAHAHALAVWHLEQALHLPSELAVQQAVTPHSWLVSLVDGYYLYGHMNPVGLLLAWVWWRHRDAYPRVRLWLVLLTATAFVVHFVPVAPPRLMPQLGFHDLALEHGDSVYGAFGDGIPGQLLAMPSLHVGWAVLVAYVVVRFSTSRWRWLVVAHPVLMTLDVAATANHWWLDGVVAAALLALCVAAERSLRGVVVRVPAAGRLAVTSHLP